MRRGIISVLFVGLALCAGMVVRAAEPSIVQPDATKWVAVTAGPYIMRFRVKDGTRFPMHHHATLENVTVISGALLFGFGTKTMLLGPGGFISVPPNTRHYSIAKGETVFQADAIGPRTMTLEPTKKM